MKNERMITCRDDKELTQGQLGEKVGLTQSMIARIESGDRDPRKDHKIALAQFFGVSVEWLFYEKNYDLKSLNNDKEVV